MESQTDKVCFEKFRIKTFANSIFERNRKNCTAKKMSDAGFYMTATEDEPDKVTCYACGVDKSSWKTTTADPWLEHQKLSPDCKYLELKKKPKMELTVNDFLTIERYRVQRINTQLYASRKNQIESTIQALEEANSDVDKVQEHLTAITA